MTIQAPQIASQVTFNRNGASLIDITTATWEGCVSAIAQTKKLSLTYDVYTGKTRTLQYDLTQKKGCCSVSYRFHYKGALGEDNERDYVGDGQRIEVGLNNSLKRAISLSRKLQSDLAKASFETSENWLSDNRTSENKPLVK